MDIVMHDKLSDNLVSLDKRDAGFQPIILIVDNDPNGIILITDILARENYSLLTALTSQEALNIVEKYTPDLIIIDNMMPNCNGIRLARIIKNKISCHNIPIILITAYSEPERKELAFNSTGTDEIIVKPVNNAELIVRVKSLLKLKIYQEQLTLRKKLEDNFAREEVIQAELPVPANNKKVEHILLVEDNLKDAKLMQAIFHNLQYIISVAETGEKALALALNNQFDLIVMDIMLPDISGYEIFKRIKQIDCYEHVPIVFLTGISDIECKIQCLEIDADGFFVKPVDGREFKAKIELLLKKKTYINVLQNYFHNAIESAIKDGLTGLYKRTYFIKCLEKEIKRSQRHGECLSIMMIDIDNFKFYNDNLGHLGGDMILREVGKVILDNIREIDIAARYGGEEFIIMFPCTEKTTAMIIAQRIQSVLLSFSLPSQLSPFISNLTVSIGIADFQHTCKSSSELINKADQMLYQAKRTGKNRICVCDD